MDKIRQALDRVRDERAEPNSRRAETVTPLPEVGSAAPKATLPASHGPFAYTKTRVFRPSPDILESNRVLDPRCSDAAPSAFRLLRTQVLQRMDTHGWRSLAIFSASPREGKTTVAINLAISIANDQQHSVLLVDFDFKQPSIAARLGFSPEYGADDVISGKAKIEDCLYHPEGFERLVILPTRGRLDDSSEFLSGPRCREIINDLRGRYPERVLLFDLPPVLSADDALSFAPFIECGLVVVMENVTRREDLARTIELLHKTTLLGTVLNQAFDVPSGY